MNYSILMLPSKVSMNYSNDLLVIIILRPTVSFNMVPFSNPSHKHRDILMGFDGCGEGGGGYKYFLSGYVLLECNMMGSVIISM